MSSVLCMDILQNSKGKLAHYKEKAEKISETLAIVLEEYKAVESRLRKINRDLLTELEILEQSRELCKNKAKKTEISQMHKVSLMVEEIEYMRERMSVLFEIFTRN
ncbi:hypothetical protein BDB01DRAFT_833169 [Pilobolus umbonatus]|nr:hypothetical protein BDB01DRAFT_833169 [Pilobolus umbonatus]